MSTGTEAKPVVGHGQSDDAAKRSARVKRGGSQVRRTPGACSACGSASRGGASHAARVLSPMVQVCSEACAADPRFADSAIAPAAVNAAA